MDRQDRAQRRILSTSLVYVLRVAGFEKVAGCSWNAWDRAGLVLLSRVFFVSRLLFSSPK